MTIYLPFCEDRGMSTPYVQILVCFVWNRLEFRIANTPEAPKALFSLVSVLTQAHVIQAHVIQVCDWDAPPQPYSVLSTPPDAAMHKDSTTHYHTRHEGEEKPRRARTGQT